MDLGRSIRELTTLKRLTERMDKPGLQFARLGDNAPTIEEFDELKEKVRKIQHHLAVD
jgi:hypothetical protein